MTRRAHGRRGYLVIETLMGLLIGLLVLGSLYLLHSSAWATWTTTDAQLTLGQETSAALNRMVTELQNAYSECVEGRDQIPGTGTGASNPPQYRTISFQLVKGLTWIGTTPTLELTHWITYQLQSGPNGTPQVVRLDPDPSLPVCTSPGTTHGPGNLGMGFTSGSGGVGGPETLPLATHVDSFVVIPTGDPPVRLTLALVTQMTTATGRTIRYPIPDADPNTPDEALVDVTLYNGNSNVVLPPPPGQGCDPATQNCGGGWGGNSF